MRGFLLAMLALAVPFASATHEIDARDVFANHVSPTECPTYSTPATVGCFDALPNATAVRIVARPDVGNAQPRLLVWVYNGTQLLEARWMCDDGILVHPTMTQVVVALEPDRYGCFDDRLPIIAHGRLTATWSV